MDFINLEQLPGTIAALALLVGYCHYYLSFPEDFQNGYKRMSNKNNHDHEES
jgi:hypothetical protein